MRQEDTIKLLERLKRLLAEDPTLAARLAAITGDGNVAGDHNVATVNKLSAGDYAIQIGQLHLTLSPDQLRSLPVSAHTASPLPATSTGLPRQLWPLKGRAAALLVVIGIAVAVVLGLVRTLLPPTFAPQPTETQVPSTTTPQPTETPTSMPALPTATPWPTETLLPPAATLRATETPTPVDYTGARPPAEADIGDTWTRPADGMVMVYVPAGEFLMGSSDADDQARDEEKPQHTVYLDAFWIDRTEVTNAQYRKCVEAGACREPGCWDNENYNAPDQPVVCVSWDDAQAYAAWAGGRLPTEAEWEKAARGTDGRIYPWGDEFDGARLNYCDRNCEYDWKDTGADDGYARTAPVGSYPAGASPYGALDMAGNVSEWVADWYDAGYYARSPARNPQRPASGDYRVLRGGAFVSGGGIVRCASRGWVVPYARFWDFGFRVVAAPVRP